MAAAYDFVPAIMLTYAEAIRVSPYGTEYPGVQFAPVSAPGDAFGVSGYLAIGPRDALLTLKYDLEKKRYEP